MASNQNAGNADVKVENSQEKLNKEGKESAPAPTKNEQKAAPADANKEDGKSGDKGGAADKKRSRSKSPGKGPRGKKNVKKRKRFNSPGGKQTLTLDNRRIAYRLFVGNLPKGTAVGDVTEFFTRKLRKSGVSRGAGKPVTACHMLKDKQFAFVEFRSLNETVAAMNFDGANMKGNNIKIERPRAYQEMEEIESMLPFAGGVSIDPWVAAPILPDPNTRESRTLWIWNVPIGVLGEEVTEFFNYLLVFAGLVQGPGDPVVGCQLILGKDYYALELRSLGEAAQAMLLDGVNFMDSSLAITRSNEPRPLAGTSTVLSDAARAALLPVSARLDRIVFVTNIAPDAMVEEMVKLFNQQMHLSGLAESPGEPIIGYQFDPMKSTALLEFRTSVEAKGAVALDGIPYLGRNLKIGWLSEFHQFGSGYENDPNPKDALGLERERSLDWMPRERRGNDDLDLDRRFPEDRFPNDRFPNDRFPEERRREDWPGNFDSALEKERWGLQRERFEDEDFGSNLPGDSKLTPAYRAPKQACRLYVGNLPFGRDVISSQDELRIFFNKQMKIAGLQLDSGYPVATVQMQPNASYAFVELRSLEETTKALALDGISFCGRVLVIKRPSSYKAPRGSKEDPDLHRSGRTLIVSCNTINDKEDMIDFLDRLMLRRELTLSPGTAVLDCTLKGNGKFNVLFRSREEATEVFSLDGVNLDGHVLHIRRPDDYKNDLDKSSSSVVKGSPDKHSSVRSAKPECRLCVGNFPYGITQTELMDFFNKLMHQTGLAEGAGNPIIGCEILPDTNLAYIEFRSASEASQALILDDLSFRGQKIKIKRQTSDLASRNTDDGSGNARNQESSSMRPTGSGRLPESGEIARVTDNRTYPARLKPETVGFSPGNRSAIDSQKSGQVTGSSPAIGSIIDHSEDTTSQVLRHVVDYQQKGYSGGAEFTAVADLLSVNISVWCANGTKMTYHPKSGVASATVEIQNPKTSATSNIRDTDQGAGRRGPSSSASWESSHTSLDTQRQGHQANVLTQSSAYPLRDKTTPPASWQNSYKSSHAEFAPKPLDTVVTSTKPAETNWLIATWNVRGAISVDKQNVIDQTLYSESVEVAALQETHLPSTSFDTPHYKWLLSSGGSTSSPVGVGFLVRRDLVPMITRWTSISDFLACLHLRINGMAIAIVTVSIPSDDFAAASTLDRLLSIVSVLPSSSHIFVVGDFNAQIGTDDLTEADRSWIGQFVGHRRSNRNGMRLKSILRECRLFLLSSMLGNDGTIVTCSKGPLSAQRDHVIGNCPASVSRVAAGFISKVDTDHKLMWAVTSVLPCRKHSGSSDFSR